MAGGGTSGDAVIGSTNFTIGTYGFVRWRAG
jgi:hypothetical protein